MMELANRAGDLVTSETVGVAIAITLLALLRVLLPPHQRHLARAPTAFLIVHLFAHALLFVLEAGSVGARAASLVATILLFACVGRSVVLISLEGVVGPRMARPLPRIFRDIIQGIVYLVLLFVALRIAGVDPGSILTTSALLTAAIALSLQETLGNLVAGLAIQMQHPFDVDDWIQFDADPKHIGKVLEINWRATKVLTLDDVEVIVPNATLAKAPITNFTKPLASSRRSIYFQVPAEIAPHIVRAAVLEALTGAHGVLEKPAPTIVVNNFIDGNLEYWLRFHTDQFHLRDGVDSAARERVWYALTRAAVPVGYPNRNVMLHEISNESRAHEDAKQSARREEALSKVDFVRVLTEEQRRKLAIASRIHLYGAGEPIVKEGERSAEMFIVQSGEVVVQSTKSANGSLTNPNVGGKRESLVDVARLGPGEFFGEMALMTGEERTATVRALKPSTLIGVDQHAVKALLEASPELAAIISRVISERQAARDSQRAAANAHPVNVEERSSQLLGRIRKFFALTGR